MEKCATTAAGRDTSRPTAQQGESWSQNHGNTEGLRGKEKEQARETTGQGEKGVNPRQAEPALQNVNATEELKPFTRKRILGQGQQRIKSYAGHIKRIA